MTPKPPSKPVPSASSAQAAPLALFVSDVHLQAALPQTTQAFLRFLREHAVHAQQLYLLGDLFEYWAGDDDLDQVLHQSVVAALRQVSAAGVAVFWMAGNRDFLVGENFAAAAGLTLVPDPHVTMIAGQKRLLAHGDAQCTDDHSYMAFRAQVRDPAWQQRFLSQPLSTRKTIIEGLREQSREAQLGKTMSIMDVNPTAIIALFRQTGTRIMIHGHTHRPGRHQTIDENGVAYTRYVLPDWDCDARIKRGGWIAIGADGEIRCYGWDGSPQGWSAPQATDERQRDTDTR